MRAIGSDLRMDYTAVGQTTHLAARMEQLADPGIDPAHRRHAGTRRGHIEVKALGPMAVKGLTEPVEVYELLGAGAVRSRFQAAAARGLTRFVGRDTELEQLYQALEHAQAGTARSSPWSASPASANRACLRIHPLASRPGLACAREQLGLLRQGGVRTFRSSSC